MPLRPLQHHLLARLDSSVLPEPDHFNSLDLLDSYVDTRKEQAARSGQVWPPPSAHSRGIFERRRRASWRRSRANPNADGGRVLVCHDFKGGYTEDTFARGYTLEFLQLVDTFVYFSHNRVTIPPRGWIDACHHHGVKVLGTLIFEWRESKPDLFSLLSPASPSSSSSSSSLGYPYTSHLIDLALARNFDGWLINVETDLDFSELHGEGGDGSAGAKERSMAMYAERLRTWVEELTRLAKERIGEGAEVIWYDSVTTSGKLEWQDALTPANYPFFASSTGIFTNYTWCHPQRFSPPGAFPDPRDEPLPLLALSAAMADSSGRERARQDVYVGVDVFGRGCWGGWEAWKALQRIGPQGALDFRNGNARGDGGDQRGTTEDENGRELALGLSVALFAPGWTWEREYQPADGQGGAVERTWEEWWADECRFWIGPGGLDGSLSSTIDTRSDLDRQGNRFLSQWCPRRIPVLAPPPFPFNTSSSLTRARSGNAFWTSFSRGSGTAFYVDGENVLDLSSNAGGNGWTDMSVCSPKPDQLWGDDGQRRFDHREIGQTEGEIELVAALVDDVAWLGSSSVEVRLNPTFCPGLDTLTPKAVAVADVQERFVPLNRIALAGGERSGDISLHATVIYRPNDLTVSLLHDVAVALRSDTNSPTVDYTVLRKDYGELANCWRRIDTVFQPRSASSMAVDVEVVLGLSVTVGADDSSRRDWDRLVAQKTPLLHVGLLSLFRGDWSRRVAARASRRYRTTGSSSRPPALTWVEVNSPLGEGDKSMWGVLNWDGSAGTEDKPSEADLYFVYASFEGVPSLTSSQDVPSPSNKPIFLGTSNFEDTPTRFLVAGLTVPPEMEELGGGAVSVTFVVRAVDELGDVEDWEAALRTRPIAIR